MRSKGRLAPNPEQHIVVPLGAWANVKYARGPWRAHGGNKEGTWRAIVPHGAWVTSSNEVVKKALQPKLDNTCAVHSSKLSCSSWQRATDAPPLVILVINWNVTKKEMRARNELRAVAICIFFLCILHFGESCVSPQCQTCTFVMYDQTCLGSGGRPTKEKDNSSLRKTSHHEKTDRRSKSGKLRKKILQLRKNFKSLDETRPNEKDRNKCKRKGRDKKTKACKGRSKRKRSKRVRNRKKKTRYYLENGKYKRNKKFDSWADEATRMWKKVRIKKSHLSSKPQTSNFKPQNQFVNFKTLNPSKTSKPICKL